MPQLFSIPATRAKRLGASTLVGGFLAAGLASGQALAGTCPITPEDTVVPIADVAPPPRPGEPRLSIKGIEAFVKKEGITNVKDLLSRLPKHMRTNYVLIEETRGLGRTDLEHPGLLLFGSDARFMMNISTDPSDPRFEVVDMAHMNSKTGEWTFRAMDFDQTPPQVSDNDAQCQECHGDPARPVWGEYLDWPGIFGNNEFQRNGPELLAPRHARRLNELRASQASSDRFNAIEFLKGDRAYQANRAMFLPDHDYGYALTLINSELGGAVAESLFLRMKQDKRYRGLREELILLGACDRERRLDRGTRDQLSTLLRGLGADGGGINDLYSLLGLDREHEFSLDRLPGEEPNLFWNAGSTYIEAMVQLLVLDDLAKDDRKVADILENSPNRGGVFSCPRLGSDVADVLTFKKLHGYTLRGSARQAVQRAFYDPDLFRAQRPIFGQAGSSLCRYLTDNIDAEPQVGQSPTDPDPAPQEPDPDANPTPPDGDPNPGCPANGPAPQSAAAQ